MSLTLSPEFSAKVQAKLAGSGFSSAEQMLQRGLELLDQHRGNAETDRAELIQMLQAGLDSLDRGEGIPKHRAFAMLHEAIAELDRDEGIPHEVVWSKVEAKLDQRLQR